MRAPTILWLLLRSRKTDPLLSRANQETTMPDELAAEKGAGSDAVSTLSNYLAIRAPSTAYQSCVHTDPSAKSEEFQTNSPRQEEPAVFDDRIHYRVQITRAGLANKKMRPPTIGLIAEGAC